MVQVKGWDSYLHIHIANLYWDLSWTPFNSTFYTISNCDFLFDICTNKLSSFERITHQMYIKILHNKEWIRTTLISARVQETRYRAIAQIPQCTCYISHNAPFRTEMRTFLFWMEHCGIWNGAILWFVKLVYSRFWLWRVPTWQRHQQKKTHRG